MRAAAKATAVGVFAILLFIPLSTVSVSAAANPKNHGHHYGQLKHHHPSPPPPHSPPPVVVPPVVIPPVNHILGGYAGIDGASVATASIATVQPSSVQGGRVPTGFLGLPETASQPPQGDSWWWLVLVLVIAVGALWLFVAARTAWRASMGFRNRTPAATQAG